YLAKALELLPNIDFDRLEHAYGEGSVLELLEWLSERRIEGEANIMVLIDMADEFYREESSKFAEIIAKTYRLDKLKFIRALAKTPEKVNIMALALHELRVYDESDESLPRDLELIINSRELTDEEREVGILLLSTYTECGT
ncbi:MAG: hypothetical protein GX329_06290, partial [Tissierellia bacterium]|nr:hypothetical protein [Tissierellia bacterium]